MLYDIFKENRFIKIKAKKLIAMKFQGYDGLNDQFMKNFNQMINTINSNWVITFNEQKKCMILFCKCINHYDNYKMIQKIVKKYIKSSRIKYWKISTNNNINNSLTDNEKLNIKGMKNRSLRIIPQKIVMRKNASIVYIKNHLDLCHFSNLLKKTKLKILLKIKNLLKRENFLKNLNL